MVSPAAPGAPALRVEDFDYPLPPELIAQHPLAQRSASRLLDGRSGMPVDRHFADLPGLLRAGDLLVFNDTAVVKARLFGHKHSGGRLEMLIERVLDAGTGAATYEALVHLRVSRKPPIGTEIVLDGGDRVQVVGRQAAADGALFIVRFTRDPYAVMAEHGHVPLPPYIDHTDSADDERRYQTVFAREPGAVAAPTAALHFDEALLAQLDRAGIERASVTLHVGAGTFAPVKVDDVRAHVMHAERYHVPQATQDALARARARGGRVVAVGTTTVRTLESWARSGDARGDTRLFITPGFPFRWVDLLITNFHLPRSTLLMLVSALAGTDTIRRLYTHAVHERYRFFSYGDAMLIGRAAA